MDILYAPWRTPYANDVNEAKKETVAEEICVFCQQSSHKNDPKTFILKHFKYHFVKLNIYPYNAGHLLIIPLRHCNQLHELTKQEQQELIWLTSESSFIVQHYLKAPAVNIGLNLGKAAGAGIPSHMHTHILPRWPGDTNFLPTLFQTKQISINLHEIYEQLIAPFSSLSEIMYEK